MADKQLSQLINRGFPAKPLPSPLEQKKYLVIDDFGDMRSMLRSMLRMLGISAIDTANNGKEAITQMERNQYDIVLCDYNLGPGKDGQQVLEEARERELIGLGTIFIMVTAENTSSMVLGAIEYQPDDYLSKPFTKDLLRSRLEKCLAKKQDLTAVNQLMAKRDYLAAAQLLDELIARRPKNVAELTKLQAEAYLKGNALNKAANIYERVLAIREQNWALMGLGRVFFARKDFAAARNIFQDLVDTNDHYLMAYDWLAKCLELLDDPTGAQETLEAAVELSPKAILRQKALGEVALKNNDFQIADKAFSQAVEQGKFSVHKHPSLYAGLVEAKIHSEEKNAKDESFKLIKQIEKEFGKDREAQLYSAMAESSAQHKYGDEKATKAAFATAEKLYERLGAQANPMLAVQLAKSAIKAGEKDKAEALFLQAVRSDHDNEELLKEVEHGFSTIGVSGSPKERIEQIIQEILDLNTKGVQLAKNGDLDGAIELFEKAAEMLSNNKIVNLNTARVLVAKIEKQKDQANTDLLGRIRKYLERVKRIDPTDSGLAKVTEKFQSIVAKMS